MNYNRISNTGRKNSTKNILVIGIAVLILFLLYSTIKNIELIAFILFLGIIAYIVI